MERIYVANRAVRELFGILTADKTQPESRPAVSDLNRIHKAIKSLYKPDVTLTVTDGDAATIDDFVNHAESELVVALGAQPRVGTIFQVTSAGDTTNNGLAAAKAAGMNIVGDFTVTDETDATLAAFLAITGQLPATLGRVFRPYERFQVKGTGDTTDNALQGVKGGAVANDDVFQVNAAGTGVTYLGNVAVVAAGDVFEVTGVTEDSEAVKYLGTATELSLGAYELEDF